LPQALGQRRGKAFEQLVDVTDEELEAISVYGHLPFRRRVKLSVIMSRSPYPGNSALSGKTDPTTGSAASAPKETSLAKLWAEQLPALGSTRS